MEKAETLKDVLINLFTGKYTKEHIIDTLAWGEKNTDIYFPLVKKHQPEYFIKGDQVYPIMSCNLLLDLEKGKSERKFLLLLKSISG